MSNLLQFKISDDHNQDEVFLEVDPSVLTDEVAKEINTFWGGDDVRLEAQDGNLLQTAVRMFGAQAISYMRADGGVRIAHKDEKSRERWTRRVLELEGEGWPKYEELGIRILSAYVADLGYFDVTLEPQE